MEKVDSSAMQYAHFSPVRQGQGPMVLLTSHTSRTDTVLKKLSRRKRERSRQLKDTAAPQVSDVLLS